VIIICKICSQYICPSACPGFEGYVVSLGVPDGECASCGKRLYTGAGESLRARGKRICADCAEELVSPELLEFLGCADIKEFFDMLW